MIIGKTTKKVLAGALTCSILFSNSLPLIAAEEYPTHTINKDDVITIEKSASWNGETAQDADFSATVTLKAGSVQNAVGELPVTKPADISPGRVRFYGCLSEPETQREFLGGLRKGSET